MTKAPLELAVGGRARIFGLESAAGKELNGLQGKLLSIAQDTGRWNVVLDSGDRKAIKAANLEVRAGVDGHGCLHKNDISKWRPLNGFAYRFSFVRSGFAYRVWLRM